MKAGAERVSNALPSFLGSCFPDSTIFSFFRHSTFGLRHFQIIYHIRVIRGLRTKACSHSEFGLIQVVHFHERHSRGVVYPTHDGRVVTRSEVCDDR